MPLGTYVPSVFWIVAVLFASEHGPYWEVGLAAGVIYNWWMVRTQNLADCIVAHAVTNGLLSAYVLRRASGNTGYNRKPLRCVSIVTGVQKHFLLPVPAPGTRFVGLRCPGALLSAFLSSACRLHPLK